MRPRGRSDREVFETLQAAEAVATRLRALTDSLGPDFISMQFYVRIRVKSYDSIIKKIYGKRRETGRELYALEDVTDIVGLRIVTLYDDDVKKALNHVLALVEANGAGLDQTKGRLDQPLFKPIRTVKKPTEWDFIREVIFFHRGRGGNKDIYKECHETLLKQLRKRFRRNRTSYRLHRKKITLRDPEKESDRENVDSFASQGYSSIHLVLNAVANVGLRSIDVPIEVQMRTAAEDIWGEINHQLFYKARDSYVWTPTLQTTYDDMLDDSNSIKKSLDDLSDPITRFWRHAAAAEEIIARFREPKTKYHNSLIVTLFYAMNDEFLDEVDDELTAYDEKIKALRKATTAQRAASALHECRKLVQKIKAEFDRSLKKLEKTKVPDAPRSTQSHTHRVRLFEQRIMLCDLELDRLKAVEVLGFRHTPVGKPRKAATRGTASMRNAFNALCERRNSLSMAVRPVAMLSYWKYLVAKHIDYDVAIYHLRLAADELEWDTSLPAWSIYRIVIPRTLAAETYEQLVNLVQENGVRTSHEIWLRSQFAVDVQAALNRAFHLALEAYRKHVKRDEKAGDLIIGYEKNEGIRAAEVTANITFLYYDLFGPPDFHEFRVSRKFLRDRAKEVRTFLIRLRSKDEWVKKTIVRMDKLLPNLNGTSIRR